MKYSLLFRSAFYLLLTTFFIYGCAGPRHYTQDDLMRLNAKEVRGVVTKQSLGSFVLTDETGEEKTYRTGQVTQYIPVDYRSQEGDKVRLSIQEVWERSGRLKLTVLQLEALDVPEKNQFISKSFDGKIVSFGRSSISYIKSLLIKQAGEEEATVVYISSKTKVGLSGETYTSNQINWDKSLNEEVQVTLKRVPVRRGNGYIFVAEEVSFL